MSLEQGIRHGKEHRKEYYGWEAVDKSARNHGSDDWFRDNRLHSSNRKEEEADSKIADYESELDAEDGSEE